MLQFDSAPSYEVCLVPATRFTWLGVSSRFRGSCMVSEVIAVLYCSSSFTSDVLSLHSDLPL